MASTQPKIAKRKNAKRRSTQPGGLRQAFKPKRRSRFGTQPR